MQLDPVAFDTTIFPVASAPVHLQHCRKARNVVLHFVMLWNTLKVFPATLQAFPKLLELDAEAFKKALHRLMMPLPATGIAMNNAIQQLVMCCHLLLLDNAA